MSTASDICAVKKGLAKGVEKIIAKGALSAYSSIVIATPVETGRARGNWQVSLAVPAQGVLDVQDKTGAISIAKATPQFASFKLTGQPIFFQNNLPYIQRLNEGHSMQAPAGFVERAILAGLANIQGAGEIFT